MRRGTLISASLTHEIGPVRTLHLELMSHDIVCLKNTAASLASKEAAALIFDFNRLGGTVCKKVL